MELFFTNSSTNRVVSVTPFLVAYLKKCWWWNELEFIICTLVCHLYGMERSLNRPSSPTLHRAYPFLFSPLWSLQFHSLGRSKGLHIEWIPLKNLWNLLQMSLPVSLLNTFPLHSLLSLHRCLVRGSSAVFGSGKISFAERNCNVNYWPFPLFFFCPNTQTQEIDEDYVIFVLAFPEISSSFDSFTHIFEFDIMHKSMWGIFCFHLLANNLSCAKWLLFRFCCSVWMWGFEMDHYWMFFPVYLQMELQVGCYLQWTKKGFGLYCKSSFL